MARKPWKQACADISRWWDEAAEREAAGKKSFHNMKIPAWRAKWQDSYNRCQGLAASDQTSAEAIAAAEALIAQSDYDKESDIAALEAQTKQMVYAAIGGVILIAVVVIGWSYVRR